MMDLFASYLVVLRDTASSLTWTPLVQASRAICLSVLGKMKIGDLEIVDANGSIYILPTKGRIPGPRATLKVHKDTFWVRLAVFGDMGFADSYLLSEISSSDLVPFFQLCIVNRDEVAAGTITASISSSVTALLRSTNTLSTARLNIAAHYDISNTMFAAFLSSDMTYSCPIWRAKEDPESTVETLEAAQDRKLARFIQNAHIKSTDRVLEIGTGWGSFAIKAVKETGCSVVSLTLSVEQKQLAEQRIEDAGLSDKITVLLCDYRKMKVPAQGRFDKIISIEMLEAVGRQFLTTYFRCIDKLLKEDGGIAVFQCITIPETRYEAYSKSDDFIRRYIFPGGHLPSVSQLVSCIATGSQGQLIVDGIENIGPHYGKTLRIWREQFMSNFETTIRPALLREHMEMTKADVELFKRKWEYYFTYCEAGFKTKTLGDVIITAGREGAMEMMEHIPL